jgi:hypothetical protein
MDTRTLSNDAPTTPNDRKFLISIFPAIALSECSGFGCSHNVGLRVVVWERPQNKEIWSGNFKVGPLGNKPVDDDLIDSFVSSVVKELKTANLI